LKRKGQHVQRREETRRQIKIMIDFIISSYLLIISLYWNLHGCQ